MSDLSNLYFIEDVIVILTKVQNGIKTPVSKTLKNMQDLMDLYKEIREGHLLPKVGDFTLDQQLWFAVARHAQFVREKGDIIAPKRNVLDELQ